MENSFNNRLQEICKLKNNRLCIGLDIDPKKIKEKIQSDFLSIIDFTKDIVDATIDLCPVYKLNLAFYECYGSKGYDWMGKIVDHIGSRSITIADGKRGDIGNTAIKYADSLFNHFGFDSVTLSPYMGIDSIIPFIEYESKGSFVLCLTSNRGANDFQYNLSNNEPLFISVSKFCRDLNDKNNLGIVVGATKSESMNLISDNSKGLSWLIPGIGAQGGNLKSSVKISNKNGIGIINVSRAILYAGDGSIECIKQSAQDYTKEIRKFLWMKIKW